MATAGRFIDCEQGSELWAKLRCGYFTASRTADGIASVKKGEAADRKNYRLELIYERLSGNPYPHHITKEMQWGLDHEADARAAYELHAGELVDRCGFVLHPTVPYFGASPDGLVNDDGLIQIKCPTIKTHLEILAGGVIPDEYWPQLMAEMSCTGREWVDFISFDPRLPAPYDLFVKRLERNEPVIEAIECEVRKFNADLEAVLKSLPPSPVVALLDQANDDEVQF